MTYAIRKFILFVIVSLVAIKFVSIAKSANPIDDAAPFGQLKEREFEGIKYHYYIPFKAGAIGDNLLPLLVLVQSKQQDPAMTAERWIEVAENEGVGLLVPVFNSESNSEYAHLDLQHSRVDFRFLKILDDAKKIWRFDLGQVYMYGHDEGGEFIHRFALIHPECVKRAAISGATDYTFPDVSVPFPYGIRRDPELRDIKFKTIEFAQLPFAVIVGKQDDAPIRGDGAAKQGVNRLERAQNFYEAMKKYTHDNHRKLNLQLKIVPDADHNYTTTLPAARDFLFQKE